MDEADRPGADARVPVPVPVPVRVLWRERARASLPRLLLAGLACAVGLAGCSTPGALRKREREADLVEFGTWLPGVYDNSAQAPPETTLVVIVPVYAPSISDHVFFAESMLASDPQRVSSEQLLSFAIDADGVIVQTNYALKDPLRWRSAYLTPELFEGLQAPDLKGMVGCPLAWRRHEDRYTAILDEHVCRPRHPAHDSSPPAAAPKPKPAAVPVLAELTADEYAVARPAGTAAARPDDPLERFHKRVQ
jgi:hypothetical protein